MFRVVIHFNENHKNYKSHNGTAVLLLRLKKTMPGNARSSQSTPG